jgi:hypothetical protein
MVAILAIIFKIPLIFVCFNQIRLYLYIELAIKLVLKDKKMTTVTFDMATFLAETKKKCEATAKKMNALELSIWNETHEQQLISKFGFSKKSLAERKKQLTANSL